MRYGGGMGSNFEKMELGNLAYPDSHTRHFLKNAKLFRFVKYLVSV